MGPGLCPEKARQRGTISSAVVDKLRLRWADRTAEIFLRAFHESDTITIQRAVFLVTYRRLWPTPQASKQVIGEIAP